MPAAAPSPHCVREKRAITISLAVTLLFGCAYILWRWGARRDWVDGTLRCVTFACAMVAVHAWSYQAYRRQWLKEASLAPAGVSASAGPPIPLDYERRADTAVPPSISWRAILAQQAFALFFSSILLDGGDIGRSCFAAVGVYWVAALIGFVSRRGYATPTDKLLLNLGYWPLAAVIAVAQALVWAMKGLRM